MSSVAGISLRRGSVGLDGRARRAVVDSRRGGVRLVCRDGVLLWLFGLVGHVYTCSPLRIRSFCSVRMRAISRFAPLDARAVLERAGGRLEAQVEQLLPRVAEAAHQLLVGQVAQLVLTSCSSLEEVGLPLHDLRLHAELLPGEAQRLLGERLRDAGQLEHDAARA